MIYRIIWELWILSGNK